MKQFLICVAFCVFVFQGKADSFWIETAAKGTIGKAQLVKVVFGSTLTNKLQKVNGKFAEVKNFTCRIVSPAGKSFLLRMKPADTAYQCTFVPEENGVYTIILENTEQGVKDWRNTSSKIGIAKQNYYARTNFIVGQETVQDLKAQPQTSVSIINTDPGRTGEKYFLQVLSHGNPVKDAALFIRDLSDSKNEQKFITDQDGKIEFSASGPGKYVALITLRHETPGTYKGIHYDVFREKSSYTFIIE